jgi:hypothetical protein
MVPADWVNKRVESGWSAGSDAESAPVRGAQIRQAQAARTETKRSLKDPLIPLVFMNGGPCTFKKSDFCKNCFHK